MSNRALGRDVTVGEIWVLQSMGFTQAEIAKQLGVSAGAVSKMLKGYNTKPKVKKPIAQPKARIIKKGAK